MMDKIMKYLPKILIVFTLGTMIIMLCAGILDRYTFHCQVKQAAIDDLKTMLSDNRTAINAPSCTLDSIFGDKKSETDRKYYSSSNSIVVVNKVADAHNNHPNAESILYVLSQSDSLLSANGLTFCVTLVVSLLAALLLYKIDSNDKLIEQNRQILEETEIIKKETEGIKNEYTSLYAHTSKFNQVLAKMGNLYNLIMLIGNLSNTLPENNSNENLHTNIATLCNKLSVVCREIEDLMNTQENRLVFLTKEEKELLRTYLEDACMGELKRLKIDNDSLRRIIENNIHSVEDIWNIIDNIKIREGFRTFQPQST